MKRTRATRVSAGSDYANFWRSATYIFIALWTLLLTPLALWGLPGRERDPLLFRGSEIWPAASFGSAAAADQRQSRAGGADVDLNPIVDRSRLVELTESDAQRAEVLRRYRLYTRQPDEMITFQALQSMKPRSGDLDPGLYQYGGGYIYTVGAALGVAHLVGYVDLRRPIDHYLDKPEDFARFYVVSRLLTIGFAVLALLGVGKLAGRLGGPAARFCAVALLAFTPVFINGATEAKPHMASAAFLIWSASALVEHTRRERRGPLLRAALLAGLSFAFVLTGLAAVVPLIWLALRRMSGGPRQSSLFARPDRSAFLAPIVALAIFGLLNPYLLLNKLSGKNMAAVDSNLSNSIAMYADQLSHLPAGFARGVGLLLMACGYLIPLLGLFAIAQLARDRTRGLVEATLGGAAMLLLCCALAAGKPAEFARFLIAPAMVLCVAIAVIIARVQPPPRLVLPIFAATAFANLGAFPYLRSLWIDLRGVDESRHVAARWLLERMPADAPLALVQEPAPYATPPIDFALRRVVLLPTAAPATEEDWAALPHWLVATADRRSWFDGQWWRTHYELSHAIADSWRSPISWANKPVYIFTRRAAPIVEPPSAEPPNADAIEAPPPIQPPNEATPSATPPEPTAEPPIPPPASQPAPTSRPTSRPRSGPVG